MAWARRRRQTGGAESHRPSGLSQRLAVCPSFRPRPRWRKSSRAVEHLDQLDVPVLFVNPASRRWTTGHWTIRTQRTLWIRWFGAAGTAPGRKAAGSLSEQVLPLESGAPLGCPESVLDLDEMVDLRHDSEVPPPVTKLRAKQPASVSA